MSTGAKGAWGGKREGAGRKKETLSARQVREMLQKAEERARKHGKTVDDVLLDYIHREDEGESASDKDRIACIKLWKEYTMSRLAPEEAPEGWPSGREGLPEQLPDPADDPRVVSMHNRETDD